MNIVTKDKEKFLQSEFEWFDFKTMKEFKETMQDDIVPCKKCGTLYWNNCLKRCKCK